MRWRVTVDPISSGSPDLTPPLPAVVTVDGDFVVVGTGEDCDVVIPAGIWRRRVSEGPPRVALIVRRRSPQTRALTPGARAEVVSCCEAVSIRSSRDVINPVRAIDASDDVRVGGWPATLRFELVDEGPSTTTKARPWPEGPWLRLTGLLDGRRPIDAAFGVGRVRIGRRPDVELVLEAGAGAIEATCVAHRGRWFLVPGRGHPPPEYGHLVSHIVNARLIRLGDLALIPDVDDALAGPAVEGIAVRRGDDVLIIDAIDGAAVGDGWVLVGDDGTWACSDGSRVVPITATAWTRAGDLELSHVTAWDAR